MTGGVVPVLNPWAYCSWCADAVHGIASGRNVPCGHAAEVVSVCPTWTPDAGCRCDEDPAGASAAAVALQEALEVEEARIRAAVSVPTLEAATWAPAAPARLSVRPSGARSWAGLAGRVSARRAASWAALLAACVFLAVVVLGAGGAW